MKKNRKKILSAPVNAIFFSWSMALYFALVLNFPFIMKAVECIKAGAVSAIQPLIVIPCFLFCLFISLFSILSIKYIEKPIFIVMTLVSSLLSYAYIYYGLMFNGTSGFISTIEQTNITEITPLLTPSLLIWFLLLGIMPAYIIYKIQLVRPSFWKEAVIKLVGVCVYPLFYVITSLPSLTTYHPLLAESGLAARLPFQIIPTNFSEEVFLYYSSKWGSYIPYKTIGLDAKNNSVTTNGKKNLLVFVVGETARSQNFQLNGYHRATNQYTKNKNIISFQNVTSCGTSTKVSVPCLFSNLSRQNFNQLFAAHRDNLLNILKRADMNLLWIENNGAGGCQGVCKPVESIVLHGFDGEVIDALRRHIEKLRGKDSVIILHIHGSHGPDYFTMYPDTFRRFKPDCRQSDLRFCDKQALMNAYDNSILYTDYVLNESIEILEKQRDVWNTALIYTSDHGESLGERGIYEHCTPYVIAPPEQTHVPLLVWSSPAFAAEKNISVSCLKNKANLQVYSHDNLFHSILGVMDISTTVYKRQLDLFKSCRRG